MIGGKNPVVEALRSGRELNKIWIAEGLNKKSIGEILSLAKESGIIVQAVPKQKLDGMLDVNHQGIIASVAAYAYAELDDLFAVAKKRGEDPFFLILDELEDPHNLGSILRTADAAGVHGIIIPKRRSVGLTGVVAKASTGAIEHIPVVRVNNLSQTVEELKKRGCLDCGNGCDKVRKIIVRWMRHCRLPLSSEAKGKGCRAF